MSKKKEDVVEAVSHEVEGIDPYSAGKHIPNPEPNNGKGEDVSE